MLRMNNLGSNGDWMGVSKLNFLNYAWLIIITSFLWIVTMQKVSWPRKTKKQEDVRDHSFSTYAKVCVCTK